ncbi:hypothetical protein GA830_06090 [Mesorhizobium sp. NBSH29]|nr:hypothetical protein GA830_06090 [Mesorhizobium sp. NBSH29]
MRVLGFARYEKRHDAAPVDVVAAALRWQEEFLAQQDGIAFHAFFGNLRGGFADLILARDDAAFAEMTSRYAEAESARKFVDLLDRESIRLCKSTILKDPLSLPDGFSCVEFGTFRIPAGRATTAQTVKDASDHIEATYLRGSDNTREHFVGLINDETYCEVVFGRSLAETRRTCLGYLDNPDCQKLLTLFDPESVDLDFWYLLA